MNAAVHREPVRAAENKPGIRANTSISCGTPRIGLALIEDICPALRDAAPIAIPMATATSVLISLDLMGLALFLEDRSFRFGVAARAGKVWPIDI
jgi:hypothetical protein